MNTTVARYVLGVVSLALILVRWRSPPSSCAGAISADGRVLSLGWASWSWGLPC